MAEGGPGSHRPSWSPQPMTGQRRPMRLPVLLYHHVGPPHPGTYPSLTISPEKFERQVRWMARRGYRTVSSCAVRRWADKGRPLPPRPLLITFDDGYAELVRFAFPVLRRYDFSAIVFVVSNEIGGTNAWDETRGSATHRLLSARQITEWSARGIEFGAHGRSHADLTLPETDLQNEVTGSATDLEAVLGQPPRAFAYPYGAVDARARHCVAQVFELAFTARPGVNDQHTDRYLFRRAMVNPGDNVLDLQLRLIDGSSPLDPIRRAGRVRTLARAARRRLCGA